MTTWKMWAFLKLDKYAIVNYILNIALTNH